MGELGTEEVLKSQVTAGHIQHGVVTIRISQGLIVPYVFEDTAADTPAWPGGLPCGREVTVMACIEVIGKIMECFGRLLIHAP